LLILLGIASAVIAVWDFVGSPGGDSGYVSKACLLMLGALAISIGLERFVLMQRLEKKLESFSGAKAKLHSLPPSSQERVERAIQDFVDLHEIRKKLRNINRPFCEIADEILNDQARLLDSLAKGRMYVPENQIPRAYEWLANNFKKRLDAVSHDDLRFWVEGAHGDLIKAAYFDLNVKAIKAGTIVTRIFIFRVKDLVERSKDIVDVLTRQDQVGIGWAVAVDEELNQPWLKALLGKSHDVAKDFALFDGGSAVSYFRKFDGRKFEAIFATDEGHPNFEVIKTQKNVYKLLVTECWLVSKQFVDLYTGALASNQAKDEVKKQASMNNDRLRTFISNDTELSAYFTKNSEFRFDHDTFLLLASGKNEIAEKVELLGKIARKFQEKFHLGS
jgi:hypothetical protein